MAETKHMMTEPTQERVTKVLAWWTVYGATYTVGQAITSDVRDALDTLAAAVRELRQCAADEAVAANILRDENANMLRELHRTVVALGGSQDLATSMKAFRPEEYLADLAERRMAGLAALTGNEIDAFKAGYRFGMAPEDVRFPLAEAVARWKERQE